MSCLHRVARIIHQRDDLEEDLHQDEDDDNPLQCI